jgi:FkbM family methyltransferase
MPGFERDGEFRYDLDLTGEEELITIVMNAFSDERPFVFFDVGANRGDWTDHLIRIAPCEYEGHLFEVSLAMVERLKENVGDDPNIIINPYALSNTNGEVHYRRYPAAEGVNSLITDTDYWDWHLNSEMATGYSIIGDEYCEENGIDHIDFLKIDTEGWEWIVLDGFKRMLSEKRIDVVQFEYGYLTADQHVSMKDFWRLFGSYGYAVGPLSKDGIAFREFTYWDNTFRENSNYVARLVK